VRRRLEAGGRRLWGETKVALPGWITARVIVLAVIPFAHFIYDHVHAQAPRINLHQGPLAWDGQWYEGITKHGYAGIPRTGVRFFPLYPLASRALGFALAHRYDVALLLLANIPALLFGALLVRLVRREGGDERAASRAAWFVALVPPAFVLTFAYSEAIAGCLAVAALVEAARGLRGSPLREIAGRLAAIGAPVAGVGAYLGWVGLRFGHPMLPIQIQQRVWLRGPSVNPVLSFFRAGRDAFKGHWGGNAIHFPLLVVAVLLVVVVFRRWPASYGAYALTALVVTLSASRLGSSERYIFTTFPFVLAIVSVTRSRRIETGALVASGACMAGFATLALLGAYVP